MTDISRKHIYLDLPSEQRNTGVQNGLGPRGGQNQDQENEEIIDNSSIYDRWKTPIRGSLELSRDNSSRNLNFKRQAISNYDFADDQKNLILNQTFHLVYILFYKQCSDYALSDVFSKITRLVGRANITYIRNVNMNFGMLVKFNNEGLDIFFRTFDLILSKSSRNDEVLEHIPSQIRLISEFKLQDVQEKINFSQPNKNEFVLPIFSNIYNQYGNENINNLISSLGVNIVSKQKIGDYVHLYLSGEYQNVVDLIGLFQGEEMIFNELRTNIFSDPEDSLVNIRKTLQVPNISIVENMPLIYLMDSGLARNTSALNQLLIPFIRGQASVPELEGVDPVKDHGTNMAGILVYGMQFLHPDLDNLFSDGLIGYMQVYSVMVGLDKPKINLYTIPELLYNLKEINEENNQNIMIVNSSFNLINTSTGYEGDVSYLSYLLDLFLFFNPSVLYVNSAGNYESGDHTLLQRFDDDQKLNYFTFPDSNIVSPGDCINTFVVGSLDECVIHSGSADKIAHYTRKSPFDNGIVKNNLSQRNRLDSMRSVIRINSRIDKPNIVSPGSGWLTTTQDSIQSLFVNRLKRGTSYSAAYISHIAGRILAEYPELKYATSLEAIILHFSKSDISSNYEIDSSLDFDEVIKDRISILNSKFSTDESQLLTQKESSVIQHRLTGGGVVNPENIINNSNHVKTIIIEGEINLGIEQIQKINLLEYIDEAFLGNYLTKFRGYITYRALPDFNGGIGYNTINIQGGLSFSGEVDKRSGHDYCNSGLWNNRVKFTSFSTRRGSENIQGERFSQMVENEYILNVHTKSFWWRNKGDLINSTINDYMEMCRRNNYEVDNLFGEVTNLSELSVPYSIILSIESQVQVDLYGEIYGEISAENHFNQRGLFGD